MAKAEEDLGVADLLLAENTSYLSAAGFHSQQAVEKFLKALLVRHQVEFPKTHDLGKLLDLLTSVEPPLAKALECVADLAPYGVQTRYPGDLPEVSREEAEEALRLTRQARERVLEALATYLGPRRPLKGADTSPEPGGEGGDSSKSFGESS
ncbi:MAG: HEPN domain-containing protein [Thermoanaerobaculia bacterium]|nr:HEPN domain-containing protein [Thermoanaerobaculia bacterium]